MEGKEQEVMNGEASYAVYQSRVVLAGERAVPDAGNELTAQPAVAASGGAAR